MEDSYKSPLSWQRIREAMTPRTPQSPIGVPHTAKASIFASVVNLCATAMGAGVLSLGHGFANTGWLLGIFLVFLFAAGSDMSLLFIVRAGRACGRHTLPGVAKHYLGSTGMWVVNLSLIILLFGCIVLVEIVAMDLLPPVVQRIAGTYLDDQGNPVGDADQPLYATRLIVGVIAISAVFPLNLLKSLRALKYTSTLAISFLCYFVLLLLVRFIQKVQNDGEVGCGGITGKWYNMSQSPCGALCYETSYETTMGNASCWFPLGYNPENGESAPTQQQCFIRSPIQVVNPEPQRVFLSLPLVISAFLCQFNILQIDNELDAAIKHKIENVVHFALLGICSMTYVVGGFLGYALEGRCVANDLLKDFSNDPYMTAARFLIGCTNLFKIPLLLVPFRTVVNEALHGLTKGKFPEKPSWSFLFVETVLIYVIVFVAAFKLGSISKDLDLIGSTVGIVIVFIIPSCVYIKCLRAREKVQYEDRHTPTDQRRGLWQQQPVPNANGQKERPRSTTAAVDGESTASIAPPAAFKDNEAEVAEMNEPLLRRPNMSRDRDLAEKGGLPGNDEVQMMVGEITKWSYVLPFTMLFGGAAVGITCFAVTLSFWNEA